MNIEELAKWLFKGFYKHIMTLVTPIEWENVHPSMKRAWLRFAKDFKENLLFE